MSDSAAFDSRYFVEIFTGKPGDEKIRALRRAYQHCRKRFVSVLVLHELYKFLAEKSGKSVAETIVARIENECSVEVVTREIALAAARQRINKKIPMADAIIAAM